MQQDESNIEVMRERLRAGITAGNKLQGVQLAQEALAAQMSPLEFFHAVIDPVLVEVGDRFSRLEIFLPELMRAGMVVKAMQEEVLEPAVLVGTGESSIVGRVVIGACQGDIHDIGKNMVALMLQVNGFEVTDLGTNVAPRTFIETARQKQADIIAMSSLLTTSMPYIRDLVQLLEGYGLRDQFLVVAGGAAVTHDWAQSVGVDGFGEDAVEAVNVCQNLLLPRKEGHV
ncbi:MAG: cobalamin-binding protein [Chloroflexi bacterium]|nr:cobalamin-binding protein [Chloroflexota bacterium]